MIWLSIQAIKMLIVLTLLATLKKLLGVCVLLFLGRKMMFLDSGNMCSGSMQN